MQIEELSYSKTTNGVTIKVRPLYLDDQSEPENQRYVWAYSVEIENTSDETVQLKYRHWRITDARGNTTEVDGPGVVGEQPVLHPGDSFEYTSGTPLATPSGIMVGTYEMETEAGLTFDVDIPAFSLDSPYETAPLN